MTPNDTDETTDQPSLDRRGLLKALGTATFAGTALGDAVSTGAASAPNAPTRLVPNDPTKAALFGTDVALNADGTRALIADRPLGDEKRAYVFDFDGNSWSQTQKLTHSYTTTINFVALDDSGTVAVANKHVYTFDGSTWTKGATLKEGAVSLDANGTTALIADTVFTKSGGGWSKSATLTPTDSPSALYGADSSLNADGTTAIVGDRANGSESRGAAYIFEFGGGDWSQVRKLNPTTVDPNDSLGKRVAIDDAGDTALASAVNSTSNTDGSVFVFERSGGTWSPTIELLAPDQGDRFGMDVALAADGTTALVGEIFDGLGGSMHIYTDDDPWTHSQRLTPANPVKNEIFGESVALAGSTALGGAPQYDGAADSSGSAVVVDVSSTFPSIQVSDFRPVQTLENTVLRDPNGGNNQIEPRIPDLVAGKPTTVMFNLTGSTDLDALPSGATVEVTVRREFSDSPTASDTFELTKRELRILASGNTNEAAFFGDDARKGKLPIFEPTADLVSISVEFDPDIDGDGDAELGTSGDRFFIGDVGDAEIKSTEVLQVGYIELADPEGGDNYGDSQGFMKGNDVALANESTRYLRETYPVPGVEQYVANTLRDRAWVNTSPGGTEAMIEDMMVAREAILDEFPNVDFDVTVVFVPEEYPDFHDDGFFGLHATDARAAAIVRGDLRQDGSNAKLNHTTAQEIGHHFLENGDAYPDWLAMRSKEDGDIEIDNAHARTLQNIDDQYVESTGFELVTLDEYGFVGRNVHSFMSYTGVRPTWADIQAYQTMLDEGLEPHSSGRGPKSRVVRGFGRIESDGSTTISRVMTLDDRRPLPSVSGGAVTMTVRDGDRSVLDERSVEDFIDVSRHTDDTARSHGTAEGAFTFALPFPDTAAEVQFEHEGTVSRLNPVERSLREMIDRLPDAAFTRSPDDRRAAFDDKLDAIDEMMSKAKYHPASKKMEKDVRDKVIKWLNDDYETEPLQPTKQELLDSVDEMIAQLERLAEQTGQAGGKGRGNDGKP